MFALFWPLWESYGHQVQEKVSKNKLNFEPKPFKKTVSELFATHWIKTLEKFKKGIRCLISVPEQDRSR